MPCKGIMQLLPSQQQCPGNFNISSEKCTWLLRLLWGRSTFMSNAHYGNASKGQVKAVSLLSCSGRADARGRKAWDGFSHPHFWGMIGEWSDGKGQGALPTAFFFLWPGLCWVFSLWEGPCMKMWRSQGLRSLIKRNLKRKQWCFGSDTLNNFI